MVVVEDRDLVVHSGAGMPGGSGGGGGGDGTNGPGPLTTNQEDHPLLMYQLLYIHLLDMVM